MTACEQAQDLRLYCKITSEKNVTLCSFGIGYHGLMLHQSISTLLTQLIHQASDSTQYHHNFVLSLGELASGYNIGRLLFAYKLEREFLTK